MHIMVDLETMGTRPDAPIIAIGAVMFDGNAILDEFYVNIDLCSAVEDGGATIDPSTVMWWMKQSSDARSALEADCVSVAEGLDSFALWLSTVEPEGIWGNGASFDNTILSEAYARLGKKTPWPFRKDRCYRTMKNMRGDIEMDRTGTHHNALDDARSQALHLIKIWREGVGV